MTRQLDELTKDVGSFHLTALMIKRVRELIDGAPALIETDSSELVKTAFEEFASGKLSITDEVVTKE